MRSVQLLFAGLGAVAVIACGDATGIDPADLAGTWTATEIRFTNQANTAESVDLLSLGVSYRITFNADGTYSAVFTEPGSAPDTTVGDVSVTGDVITISESGQGSPTPFVASRSGNTLTLTTQNEEYDFDDDGTEEDATLRVVLRKN